MRDDVVTTPSIIMVEPKIGIDSLISLKSMMDVGIFPPVQMPDDIDAFRHMNLMMPLMQQPAFAPIITDDGYPLLTDIELYCMKLNAVFGPVRVTA